MTRMKGSLVLYREMMRQNVRAIGTYGFAAILYEWLLEWVYPTLANNQQINDLLRNMPPALSKLINAQGGMHSLPDYMSSEFYNILWPLILAVFTISLSASLIARFVEKQSMAQLLATQLTRKAVAITQGLVLVSGIVLVSISSFVGLWVGAMLFHESFAYKPFFHMTVSSTLLFCVIGGYSFLLSCSIDDSKRVIGIAGGLTGLFYVLQMASQMVDQLNWLSHVSLFWFYQPAVILTSSENIWWHDGVLFLVAFVLFWCGQKVFRVRSLLL